MNHIDQQIRVAHQELDTFSRGGWTSPAPTEVTDRMHALLVARADELMDCTEGSPEESELASLVDAIEAYEAARWPNGKIMGGKG